MLQRYYRPYKGVMSEQNVSLGWACYSNAIGHTSELCLNTGAGMLQQCYRPYKGDEHIWRLGRACNSDAIPGGDMLQQCYVIQGSYVLNLSLGQAYYSKTTEPITRVGICYSKTTNEKYHWGNHITACTGSAVISQCLNFMLNLMCR